MNRGLALQGTGATQEAGWGKVHNGPKCIYRASYLVKGRVLPGQGPLKEEGRLQALGWAANQCVQAGMWSDERPG